MCKYYSCLGYVTLGLLTNRRKCASNFCPKLGYEHLSQFSNQGGEIKSSPLTKHMMANKCIFQSVSVCF